MPEITFTGPVQIEEDGDLRTLTAEDIRGEKGDTGDVGPPGEGVPAPQIEAFTDSSVNVISTLVTSSPVEVSGPSDGVWPVMIRGEGTPEMRVNSQAWGIDGLVRNGDEITARLTCGVAGSTRSATVYAPGESAEWSVFVDAAGPVIASVSQSSVYPNGEATLARMTDGLAEPFGATNNAASEWIMLTLAEQAFVTSVYLGSSTATGGWGASYINGAVLERSTDGTNWTTVQTLSGFTNGSFKTVSVGADCRYLRVRATNAFLAVGEFSVT